MKNKSPFKIDVFTNMLLVNYKKIILEILPSGFSWKALNNPALSDLEGSRQTVPDCNAESESNYLIHHVFGWPYETTAAMTHLVFGGIMDRHPGLKIITHHCGAMIPFFEQRIAGAYSASTTIHEEEHGGNLSEPPLAYFKRFYADTALSGGTAGLMCGYAFFGADHLLFGSDMPFDNQFGTLIVKKTIQSIEQMAITKSEKKMIFEDNAKRLLRL